MAVVFPGESCTALLDQLDGAAGHVRQHVNLAVVAKAPLERVLTFAAERGWRRLRLLSSVGSTYNRDYMHRTVAWAHAARYPRRVATSMRDPLRHGSTGRTRRRYE